MRRFWALLLALMCGAGVALADPTILRRGNQAEPDTLDPQKWFTSYESEIMRDLFAGLTEMDNQSNAIPGAASSWDESADGLTLTFHLRPEGKWSDGAPVTADDFVLGIRRGFDPKTISAYANLGYVIVNGKDVAEGKLPPDQLGVRAVDPMTLEVRLNRPSQTILWLFGAYPNFFPVPKHLFDKVGDRWIEAGTMISNGAYSLVEWSPQDHIRLVKNPNFYAASTVSIDEVYYYPTADDAAAEKQFRAGELDLNLRFPPGDFEMLKRDLPQQTIAEPAEWLSYLVLNFDDKRFADARVRKALSLAIDRDLIATRVLRNGELPAWSLMPPMTRNFIASGSGNFSKMAMADRQAEAKRLLAEAGYDDSNPLRFTFLYRIGEANKRAAIAIRDMWKAIGVDADLESNEVKTHYARLRQKQFDVADAGFTAPPDPEFYAYLVRSDSAEINFGGWSNAEYDRLTDEAAAERDMTKRGALFAEAEKLAMDDTALIPVYIPVNRALVQTWVKNYVENPVGQHPTRWLKIER